MSSHSNTFSGGATAGSSCSADIQAIKTSAGITHTGFRRVSGSGSSNTHSSAVGTANAQNIGTNSSPVRTSTTPDYQVSAHNSGTNSNSKTKRLGIFAMLMASLCFSTGGLLLKIIPWNPLAINGARNLIACCVIGGFMFFTHHRVKFNGTVLAGAICMAGVTSFFVIANKLTTAGNAIILQFTAPIWIILFMFLFFRKKPGSTEIVSILIVLTGILFFFFDSLSSGRWLGDLLALISGIFYAGLFMLNEFEKGDALSSMFFGQLLSGVCLSPLVCFETDFSASVLIPIAMLGIVQVGIAYIFFSVGTRYTEPVAASVINAIEPVLNPTLVAIFYGEVLGPLPLIGAAIVIAGVLYYSLRSGK